MISPAVSQTGSFAKAGDGLGEAGGDALVHLGCRRRAPGLADRRLDLDGELLRGRVHGPSFLRIRSLSGGWLSNPKDADCSGQPGPEFCAFSKLSP